MKRDPEFVILKYQAWMEASEFEDTILGAVAKEPFSPSTNYVPDSPLKYMTHEHQKGSATDFILADTAASSKELAISPKSIGGYSVGGSREDSVRLAGKFIRYKRIRQLDQFWAKLKEDADVKQTVPRWVSFFNKQPVSDRRHHDLRKCPSVQGRGTVPHTRREHQTPNGILKKKKLNERKT